MLITPAILATSQEDFHAKLFHPGLRSVAASYHVDIMDGTLTTQTCWADPHAVGVWDDVPPLELHLMVADPLAALIAWRRLVPSVTRAIIHIESRVNKISFQQIHATNLAITLAVSPRTVIDDIAPYLLHIDELMVMGVEPGASGQTFLGELVYAKIRRARSLFPKLALAIDGGVSLETVGPLAELGVQRCVASSAIWKDQKPEYALRSLEQRSKDHAILPL